MSKLDINQVYNGDSKEMIKSIESESIDPPYKISINNKRKNNYKDKIAEEVNKYCDELKKTILRINDVNDDSVLSIASSLFKKIVVETNRDRDNNKKAVLHCQLKIKDSDRQQLSLSQLSLLPRSDKGLCNSYGI